MRAGHMLATPTEMYQLTDLLNWCSDNKIAALTPFSRRLRLYKNEDAAATEADLAAAAITKKLDDTLACARTLRHTCVLALADPVFGPQKAGDIALLTFLLDYLRENADTALVKGQTLEVLSEAFKKNQFPTIKRALYYAIVADLSSMHR